MFEILFFADYFVKLIAFEFFVHSKLILREYLALLVRILNDFHLTLNKFLKQKEFKKIFAMFLLT